MTIDVHSLNDLPNIYNQQYTKEVSDSIERINTGLKINDTADDTAAAIISTSLRANSSSLGQGIQNATTGYGLIEVSNNALDFQKEILDKIKTNLELAEVSDASTRDTLRVNIQNLIEDFDNIASSTTFNDVYTLQQSNSDSSASSQVSINFTASTSVTTPSIQSNSEGINLSTLKNLSENRLTLDEVSDQLNNIDVALITISDYKSALALTKEELGINIDNLKTIEEGNKRSELSLTQADLSRETVIFDKYKLLVENSSFALAQANTTQSAVLELLTAIPDYEPVVNDNTTTNTNNTFTSTFESSSSSSTVNKSTSSNTGSSFSTSSSRE